MKYEEGKPILDPRVFIKGKSLLWENENHSGNQPLMYGTLVIPTRFINFVHDYTIPHYNENGERCLTFNVSYWENTIAHDGFKQIPLYRGAINVYHKRLVKELREEMLKAYKYQRL